MTTTDIQGVVQTSDGLIWHMVGEPTDAAAESVLNMRDIAGNADTVGNVLQGRTIVRIALQASDGSILTSLNIYGPGGERTHSYYGGERLASSNAIWNFDIRGIAIPVTKATTFKVVSND